MTRAQRLSRLETQRRPAHVAAILARVRQCPPADLQTVLLDTFFTDGVFTMDQATAHAIVEQLTDAEADALFGPELLGILGALLPSEVDALALGDPAVTRKVQRALRSL